MEMLVVMAVLVVLMSLLFPLVQGIMQRNATATSAMNLRQLGAALHAFAADNNGFFPPSASEAKDAEGRWEYLGSWDGFILPYLGVELSRSRPTIINNEAQVRAVASVFSHPRDKSVIDATYPSGRPRDRRSYALPHRAGMVGVATWGGTGWNPSAAVVRVLSPANTILLIEKPGYDGNMIGRTGHAGALRATDQFDKQADLNAGGRFNYLFCDGHVRLLHPRDTIGTGTLQNPRGLWTIDPND
jgi:prepilin-type processing-associated H-X9-DG protein